MRSESEPSLLPSWLAPFTPRDVHLTARVITYMSSAAAVMQVITTLFFRSATAYHLDLIIQLALVIPTMVPLLLPRAWTAFICTVAPVYGAIGLVASMLVRHDESAGNLILFSLTVLYGASQLKPAGVALATVSSAIGATVYCFSVDPVQEAVSNVAYAVPGLLLTGWLLGRSAQAQASLVSMLEHRAAIDPLTGLVTRHVLDEAAHAALVSAAGEHAGTGFILLDVDHFKAVNDGHGHPVGDRALVHIGELLSAKCRSSDVIARMGGDEIAVLLPGCSYADALLRAGQLVVAISSNPLITEDETVVPLSVSVGVAHAPDHAVDVHELYKAADAALYEAKRGGRGRVGNLVGVQ